MDILPATTVTDLSTGLGGTIEANAGVIIGTIALAVGIVFVVRWFNKSTRRIKA